MPASLTFTTGDLLTADVDALVNAVNCDGIMGKGIALQFKQAWPAMFVEYQRLARAGQIQPGAMQVHRTGSLLGPRFIINFPTKRHWKHASRLEDIRSGLVALTQTVRELGIRSIALPALGCGNGGLRWEDVRPLIEGTVNGWSGDVRVMVFGPGR
jgi:O-acetyl-ADP-ribose deacetylase (regulator of RNase III)